MLHALTASILFYLGRRTVQRISDQPLKLFTGLHSKRSMVGCSQTYARGRRLAECIYVESVRSVNKLEAWLSDDDPAPVDAKKLALIMNTFEIYLRIAQDKAAAKTLNRHKTIAPVEFTVIAVFISKFKVCVFMAWFSRLMRHYRTSCL
jgi:hypothetical protein